MALQIENPETIRLIDEVCQRTGLDPETVVQLAVQERLARLRTPEERAEQRARVYEIVKDLQAMAKKLPEVIVDPGELLYGEDGLPK